MSAYRRSIGQTEGSDSAHQNTIQWSGALGRDERWRR